MKKKLPLSLGLILLFTLFHGAIYIWIIPPWQHYDEPSHFEHVWKLANGMISAESDELALDFRRKLVLSMLANDFYRDLPAPDPKTIEHGTQISGLEYSQLDEPPIYYLLASVPVRFLQEQNPAVQLYGARVVSLILLLLTMMAIWGISAELPFFNHSMQVFVPYSAALLPGFVDLMTAVNSDVGAVTAFSWFLWGSLRFLKHPFSIGAILWVIGSTIACAFTKSTVYIAIPLCILVLCLGWIRGKVGKLIWFALIAFGSLGILALFSWQDAANWHRATSQRLPTRARTDKAPWGNYALQIESSAPTTPDWLRPLNQPFGSFPINREVTFGVWMWVDSNGLENGSNVLRTPMLNTGNASYYEVVSVSATPTFYGFQTILPLDTNRLWLALYPAELHKNITVYYDGFVLIEGAFPISDAPVFDDASGFTGTWGGVSFQNLIRNASAEYAWPAVRPEVDTQLSRLLPDDARVSMLLFGAMDWAHTHAYFRAAANNLVETFWGRFGWGHVYLNPLGWYKVFGFLSVAGLTGFGLFLLQRKFQGGKILLFLSISTGLIWISTWVRGEIFIFAPRLFAPGARYAYPAIGPTLVFLLVGWKEWGRLLARWLPFKNIDDMTAGKILFALFFLTLDVFSIHTILAFYERI